MLGATGVTFLSCVVCFTPVTSFLPLLALLLLWRVRCLVALSLPLSQNGDNHDGGAARKGQQLCLIPFLSILVADLIEGFAFLSRTDTCLLRLSYLQHCSEAVALAREVLGGCDDGTQIRHAVSFTARAVHLLAPLPPPSSHCLLGGNNHSHLPFSQSLRTSANCCWIASV